MEGFPWDDVGKILQGGQRMAKVHSGEGISLQASTPCRAHEREGQTDGSQIDDRQTDLQ